MITPIIHRFDEVGSTNDVALEMARKGAPEGTVVLARSQTKGRGRRGRTWLAKPGESLILTTILRPPPERYRQMAFVAAVAVAECLEQECGLEPQIKWPNDVLINDRKICGVLTESASGAVVIGIGVNVLQTDFPEEIANRATSVAIEQICTPLALSNEVYPSADRPGLPSANGAGCSQPIGVDALAESIVRHLFAAYELSFEEILVRWRKYIWGLGRPVDVTTEGGTITGMITGIDSDGALLIDEDGGIRRVLSADAINVRMSPSLQSEI